MKRHIHKGLTVFLTHPDKLLPADELVMVMNGASIPNFDADNEV